MGVVVVCFRQNRPHELEWINWNVLLSGNGINRGQRHTCSKRGKQLTTWQTNVKIYSIDKPVISGMMGKVCHFKWDSHDVNSSTTSRWWFLPSQRSWSAGLNHICTNSRWGKVYVYAVIRTRWPILTSHLWLGESTLQTCDQLEPHLTAMMRMMMMMPKVLTFHNRFHLVICLTLSLTYILFVIVWFALLHNYSSTTFLLWIILTLLLFLFLSLQVSTYPWSFRCFA